MSMRRVAITGMGTVNPLAHDVESTWQAMMEGKIGIRMTEIFDASEFPTKFSAQVVDYNMADQVDDAEKHKHASRHCTFALGAAVQAWKQSGLNACDDLNRDRVGVYLGSGEGSLDFDSYISAVVDSWDEDHIDTLKWAQFAFERMDKYREVEQESHMVAAHIAAQFGIRGPASNMLTACAASTQALGEATWLIRNAEADIVISGGAHSMIHPLGVTGFNRLTALSTRNDEYQTSSRPFDLTRDGFVLGEGASILILEDYDHAVARGANILAEIVGYGASADAFRITDQDPEGNGAAKTPQRRCRRSKVCSDTS